MGISYVIALADTYTGQIQRLFLEEILTTNEKNGGHKGSVTGPDEHTGKGRQYRICSPQREDIPV